MLWDSTFTFDSMAKLFDENGFYTVEEEGKFVLDDGLLTFFYSANDVVFPN
jgi:hypothetical protein